MTILEVFFSFSLTFSVVLTLLFLTAFNILMNFGIAITYPTLISLGVVLSVPVNASKSPPRPDFSIWTHLIFHDIENPKYCHLYLMRNIMKF